MRPSCGLPVTIRVAIFTFLVVFFSGLAPRVSRAQAASALPKSWNDAVAKLGDEVAAAMSPTAVALSVENISSLDASYVAAIGAALREQLQHHSFALPAANSTAAQSAVPLQLTLSESADEYLWVLQILDDQRKGIAVPVMIVAAPKADFADAGADAQSLSLEKRFVWKQAERFLDFALLKDATSGELTLFVLGTHHLTTYKPVGSHWQLSRTSAIPQATPVSRDPRGTINLKVGKILVQGIECVGNPDLTGNVKCDRPKSSPLSIDRMMITGIPRGVGALVPGQCRGEFIWLFTGDGDWTQADSIRGYLSERIPTPMVPTGNAIEVNGPVTSLLAEPDTSAARMVVHNLKTGEYEAYIVTATCGN